MIVYLTKSNETLIERSIGHHTYEGLISNLESFVETQASSYLQAWVDK